MSAPTVTCQLCGRSRIVTPDGRGFPPDIAKRKLRRECAANGCACDPQYRAGIDPRLERLINPGGES